MVVAQFSLSLSLPSTRHAHNQTLILTGKSKTMLVRYIHNDKPTSLFAYETLFVIYMNGRIMETRQRNGKKPNETKRDETKGKATR